MTYQHAVPLSPIAEDRVAEAAKFADTLIAPYAQQWESERSQPTYTLRQAIINFAGLTVPEKLGGEGHSFSTLVRCYEELAARDLGFTCAFAVHCAVVAAATKFPDSKLRQASVESLVTGKAIGAFVLTEPETGSDAAAITSRADAHTDGYRLNGKKAWVTNGVSADLLLTFCQTDPSKGAKGIAGFVLEREQPGLQFSAPLELIASHAMGTTNLVLSDVDVPASRVSFAPGSGFSAAMSGLNVARVGVAAMCNGALMDGLKAAVEYAKARSAFGQSIFNFQGIQFALAEVATQLEASRALTLQAAYLLDQDQDATLLAAHAKKFATKTAFQGLSACLQVLGANGLKNAHGLHRQMSASRVCEFMDGTTEIQNIVIARSLLKSF